MKGRFSFFCNLCMVVAGVIGAGFATGQELLVYFKGKNPIVVCIACSIFFCLFFLCGLFNTGEIIPLNKEDKYMHFCKRAIKFFAIFSCSVVLCAMLSGAKNVVCVLVENRAVSSVLGLIVAFVCVAIVVANKRGLQTIGILFAPLILICLVLIIIFTKSFSVVGEIKGSVYSSLLYVSLNSIFLTTLISDTCIGQKIKIKIKFCIFCAIACGVLLFFTLSCIAGTQLINLPLVQLSFFNKRFGVFYTIVVLMGVATTICASALPIVQVVDNKVNCRIVSTLMVFSFGWLVSLVDFVKLIEKLYPIVSFFGIIILILSLIGLIRYYHLKKEN